MTARRAPDLEGARGRAWLAPPSDEPQTAATLCTWLLHVPGAHPFWSWWTLSVVHLREGRHPRAS